MLDCYFLTESERAGRSAIDEVEMLVRARGKLDPLDSYPTAPVLQLRSNS
jgi:hypothetical protein